MQPPKIQGNSRISASTLKESNKIDSNSILLLGQCRPEICFCYWTNLSQTCLMRQGVRPHLQLTHIPLHVFGMQNRVKTVVKPKTTAFPARFGVINTA